MLNILLIQPDIIWEEPEANRQNLDRMMDGAGDKSDVIILPELFTTGFTMRSKDFSEPMNGKTMEWMAARAQLFRTDIVGSLIIAEGENFFNRLVWMHQNGNYQWYDKRHLFRMSGEDKNYSSGGKRINVEVKGFRFRPLICYDLRFPVWSRNCQDYDVLIYSANWPAQRMDVWKTLLRARALENQAYCIGVNRVGNDGENIKYSGESLVYDMKGREIACLMKDKASTMNVQLSLKDINAFREKFPVWKDADPFTLEY